MTTPSYLEASETELAEMRVESNAVIMELLHQYTTTEKLMDDFIRWLLLPHCHWDGLWIRFQTDGTMAWDAFERYVHWEAHFPGDTRRIFSHLDTGNTGMIRKGLLLETRRAFEAKKDVGDTGVEGFRRRFADHWGTLGRGWRLALDTTDTGFCCQLHFMRSCHSIGMQRNMRTLWTALTKGEVTRSIQFKDLDPECDRYLRHFALALSMRHGNLREGWIAICRAGGGHLHKRGFYQACQGLGIDHRGGQLLYAVLDPNQTRYLTEFDKLDFLGLWDPGDQPTQDQATRTLMPTVPKEPMDPTWMPPTLVPPEDEESGDELTVYGGPTVPEGLGGLVEHDFSYKMTDAARVDDEAGQFEFKVILTKEEYSEYLRRRRTHRLFAGLRKVGAPDPKTVGLQRRRARMVAPGGRKPRPPSAPPKFEVMAGGISTLSHNVDAWTALSGNRTGTIRETVRAVRPATSLGGLLQSSDYNH